MERFAMPLNERIEEQGLELRIQISFSDKGDGKMELFGFAISDGCNCCDYSGVINQTTLADILKEFVR